MFIGNFIVDVFFGIATGIYVDNFLQAFVFSVLYSAIEIISLLIFRRKELEAFKTLVKRQEDKFGIKTTISSNIVWFIFRIGSAFVICYVIATIVLFIKLKIHV